MAKAVKKGAKIAVIGGSVALVIWLGTRLLGAANVYPKLQFRVLGLKNFAVRNSRLTFTVEYGITNPTDSALTLNAISLSAKLPSGTEIATITKDYNGQQLKANGETTVELNVASSLVNILLTGASDLIALASGTKPKYIEVSGTARVNDLLFPYKEQYALTDTQLKGIPITLGESYVNLKELQHEARA